MTTIAAKIPDNYFKIDLIDSMEGTPIEATPPGSSRTFRFTALGKNYKYTLEKYPENSIVQKYVNIYVNYSITILKEQLPSIPIKLFTLNQKEIEQIKQQELLNASKFYRSLGHEIKKEKEIEEIKKGAQKTIEGKQDTLQSFSKIILEDTIRAIDENFSCAKLLCNFDLDHLFMTSMNEPSNWVKQISNSFSQIGLKKKSKKIKSALEDIVENSYHSQYMENAEKHTQQISFPQDRSNNDWLPIAAVVVALVSGYFAYADRFR